ncbi:MAG: TraB/GumN family protein [Algoriphagus sp.]|nr:TraB/GumN family protein [Algoriphagus sp.]
MMIKLLKGLGIVLLLVTCVFAPVKAQSDDQSSLLWKISGNGLTEESYLFGTIHIICSDEFLMDDRIKNAFQSTDQLVMELDMSDPDLQQKMAAISINPGMRNIQEDMDAEDAKALDDFLIKSYGAGLAQLGVLKPFVLTSMVMIKQLPCEEVVSYEEFFTSLATDQKKPVKGLETVEYQMGIFDQIPAELQLAELVKMVTSDESEAEFEKMVETYLSEDLDRLYAIMKDSDSMVKYQDIMLDNRNRNWVTEMDSSMRNSSVFFAVGGGHLAGENGIINLLRRAGYKMEPVKN